MKKAGSKKERGILIAYLVFLLLSFSACNSGQESNARPESDSGSPEITFNMLEYDFGRITEGEKVACTFKYKNTGDGKLLINSATTSCGCTVPSFDDKPLAQGEEGSMEVVFDSSHREGAQSKTITVRSNARVKVMVLRINAEVVKAED